MRVTLIFLSICLLLGCAARPSPEELANADYGAYPHDAQHVIDEYLAGYLKDPESARYKHLKGPRRMWASYFRSSKYGYGVCAYINAKNSLGAYTGRKLHFFLIRDGVVVRHYGGGDEYAQEMAKKMCSSF